jgi:hypothetical protein
MGRSGTDELDLAFFLHFILFIQPILTVRRAILTNDNFTHFLNYLSDWPWQPGCFETPP